MTHYLPYIKLPCTKCGIIVRRSLPVPAVCFECKKTRLRSYSSAYYRLHSKEIIAQKQAKKDQLKKS